MSLITGQSVPRPNFSFCDRDEGDEIVHSCWKQRGRVNPLVLGSSPSGPTIYTNALANVFSQIIRDKIMMGRRQKLDGIGQDAVSGWRHYIHFRPGERVYAKRRLNRQERRRAHLDVRCVVRSEIS